MKRPVCFLPILLLLTAVSCSAQDAAPDSVLQFVFTSDVHYGITRPHFRGADEVSSTVVNRAMIASINRLPANAIPHDEGAGAGQVIGHLDGILITGDIANREETGIQSAAVSWGQFEADYDHLVNTTDRRHQPTPILLGPGNHDVSNTVGFWRPLKPATDASSMAGIYNSMMHPAHPLTAATYNYATDKVHFIRYVAGVRIVFLNLWPDSTEQSWMQEQLKLVHPGTPVLLFAHSQPDVEARFFTNPNGDHGIDSIHKFENLLPEIYRGGRTLKDSTLTEQRGFVNFLQHHPEIKAYFHGHNNHTEYYRYKGPDKNVSLPCFRVDSPMKGKYSANDETLLSFELITIDTRKRTVTVRECRWNSAPGDASVLKWGETRTMGL
jgi:hypothetical protein